ncbi:MAG: type II toxin-antitoxin system RelE/ParE family toxin [Bryobacteraceae bacterium]
MIPYVLSAQAQQNLQQIRGYLLQEAGFRVARHVMSSMVAAFRALSRTPGQGHRREDLTQREELRFWAVFSYLIVYRIDKRPLVVVAVIHAKRNVEQVLEGR